MSDKCDLYVNLNFREFLLIFDVVELQLVLAMGEPHSIQVRST